MDYDLSNKRTSRSMDSIHSREEEEEEHHHSKLMINHQSEDTKRIDSIILDTGEIDITEPHISYIDQSNTEASGESDVRINFVAYFVHFSVVLFFSVLLVWAALSVPNSNSSVFFFRVIPQVSGKSILFNFFSFFLQLVVLEVFMLYFVLLFEYSFDCFIHRIATKN